MALLVVVPPLGGGGLTRTISVLLNGLDRERVKPSVALTHSLASGDRLIETLPSDVDVAALDKKGFLDQYRVMRSLRAHIDASMPDVVLGMATYASLMALAARRGSLHGPAVIATEHSTPELLKRPDRRWLLWLARRLYPQADAVLAVSQGLRDAVVRAYGVEPDSVQVTYSAWNEGIDEALRDDATLGPPLGDGKGPVVAFVGRLAPGKGIDDLIRAIAIVRRTRAAQLVLVGDGPLRSSLETLARDLGVADAVTFRGWIEAPYRHMAAAAVLVVPSHAEALGMVIIEGLRSGAAIVATDCEWGPRELITDGHDGLLVPVGDPVALAAAIGRILAEPGLADRLRAAARRTSERYSPARVIGGYEELITRLAAERRDTGRTAVD